MSVILFFSLQQISTIRCFDLLNSLSNRHCLISGTYHQACFLSLRTVASEVSRTATFLLIAAANRTFPFWFLFLFTSKKPRPFAASTSFSTVSEAYEIRYTLCDLQLYIIFSKIWCVSSLFHCSLRKHVSALCRLRLRYMCFPGGYFFLLLQQTSIIRCFDLLNGLTDVSINLAIHSAVLSNMMCDIFFILPSVKFCFTFRPKDMPSVADYGGRSHAFSYLFSFFLSIQQTSIIRCLDLLNGLMDVSEVRGLGTDSPSHASQVKGSPVAITVNPASKLVPKIPPYVETLEYVQR